MRNLSLGIGTLAGLFVVTAAAPTRAELIYGLLNNDTTAGQGQRLVTINSTTLAVTSTITVQTPSAAGSLSSIDVDPSTGTLFGFSNGTNQIYKVNPTSGVLSLVGTPLSTTSVNGGTFDIDPVADLLRFVGTSGSNQNFRVSPSTGTVVATDPSLTYATTDRNAGATPFISGIGFTGKAGTTSTSLYDIDTAKDVLTVENPLTGVLTTVGGLGFDAAASSTYGTFSGFDISSQTGTAYLSDSPAGTPPFFGGPSATTATLYTVNLTTGAATSLGNVSGLPFGRSIVDVAVAPVPEPTTIAIVTIAGGLLLGRRRRKV